jgi:ribonuclease BN (tRNA processing enzyme)
MYDPSARRRAKASMQIYGPGRRGALPPLAPGMKDAPVIHSENPSAGTRDLVESVIAGMSADLNIRVRSEGVPDIRQFFQAHDIEVPDGVVKDPNTDPAPPMDPFPVWQDERVKVSAILVPHGLVYPNFAYRFDTKAGSVVFSGDTAVSENLIKLARGADFLVHEAIDPAWVDHIVGAKPWDASKRWPANCWKPTPRRNRSAKLPPALASRRWCCPTWSRATPRRSIGSRHGRPSRDR